MIVKKSRKNQKEIQSPSKKSRILINLALFVSLVFGKPGFSFSQSSNSDNDQQIILATNYKGFEGFSVLPVPKSGQNHNGLFGNKKDNNIKESPINGNSDDGPGDEPGENPSFEIDSDSKKNRLESKSVEHHIYENKNDVDSETEDESNNQCSIEEIKSAMAKDGTIIHVPASQVRDKGLHIPDFLDEERLHGKFDVTEAEGLKYSDRLNYLRDKNNLPDEIVYEARDEILDFMTADDTILVPGFLGYRKLEGTVFVNTRLNKVGFRDYNSYKFRTGMTMNDEKILELTKNGFHLFPTAGEPET